MSTSYIISLTITLFVICKDYIIKTRIYDYALYFLAVMAWIGTFYTTKLFYMIAFIAFLALCFASNYFWGNDIESTNGKKKVSGKDESDTEYMPMFKGKTGKVNSVFTNGSYLGSMINNGSIEEVLIYSDDKLEKGDSFQILGIFSGKIRAIKI